jgi:hypothetical protein
MAWTATEFEIKVIAVEPLTRYRGEAILADPEPKYVVAAQIVNSKHTRKPDESEVEFNVYDVAFFAIHSLDQVFGETQVLWQTFKVRLEMNVINDKKVFLLLPSES